MHKNHQMFHQPLDHPRNSSNQHSESRSLIAAKPDHLSQQKLTFTCSKVALAQPKLVSNQPLLLLGKQSDCTKNCQQSCQSQQMPKLVSNQPLLLRKQSDQAQQEQPKLVSNQHSLLRKQSDRSKVDQWFDWLQQKLLGRPNPLENGRCSPPAPPANVDHGPALAHEEAVQPQQVDQGPTLAPEEAVTWQQSW
jgi:hypothetical protein